MGHFEQRLFLGCALSALACAAQAAPAAGRPAPAEAARSIAIEAGPLDAALLSLAAQTKVRIFFTSDLVAGLRAPRITGAFTPAQALAQLLAGTGLEAHLTRPGVIVLRRAAPKPGGAGGLHAVEAAALQPAPPPTNEPPEPVPVVEEVVVGSHIRGVRDTPSPVVVMDRRQIDENGYASVAEALNALPQAYGGQAGEQASTTNSDRATGNDGMATGVNLRGLGAGATLVLVNGRRMAGTGSKGDFADVSAIPLAAVERVEALLDGASALYGSDAVGGVVNIVLRTRFDGAETRAGYGAAAGGYDRLQFAQSLGRTWSGGQALIAYEYQGHSHLPGYKRAVAGDADLRSLGGDDWRQYYAQPGNILGLNGAGTAYEPKYAIPYGQNGVGLKPADFQAGQVNLSNQRGLYDLLPEQARHSVYGFASQEIGDRIELSADARYSRRDFTTIGSASTASLTVTPANPYFVSPTRASSALIAYSFANELGGTRTEGLSESLGFSAGATARLPADWRAEAYVAYAQERAETRLSNVVNSAYLSEALGTTPDNPATPFSVRTDGYFNPYIGEGSNPRRILDFIASGYEHRKDRSETMSVNLKLDGVVLTLPGGPVRVAIGGQLRRETLKTNGESLIAAATPTAILARDVARQVDSAFGELNLPIFGPANALPGLRRLELSVAGRYEAYEDMGSSTKPKVGLIWSPAAGLTLKASYGGSFRAPTLVELFDPFRVGPTFLPGPNGRTLSLILLGGNPDLKPETATSWTAGFEFSPSRLADFRLNANLFDTRFENRIAQPAQDNILTVLTSPELAPFRTFVSPATNPADLQRVTALVNSPGALQTNLFPPTSYGAIADARYVNTGALTVRGIDASASYATRIAGERVDLTAAMSWLAHYERKVTPTSQTVDLAGIAGYPAKIRARGSASWTHGPFSASFSLNYVSPGHDAGGGAIGSWTTADLQLRVQPTASGGFWRGTVVSLTVQNLLDTDPPFYNSPLGVAYDPVNADALGRVAAVQLTKAW